MGYALGADEESVDRRCGTIPFPKATYLISGPRRAIGQTMPYLFSCLVQLRGSALLSKVTVRSAGAEPLAMAWTMRGDTIGEARSYSINSSALISTLFGTVRPSAFAVWRFKLTRNLVGI
jgi:hypothetical protein